jgi:hypothetical protein
MKQTRLTRGDEPRTAGPEHASTGSGSSPTVERERSKRRWLAWTMFAFGAAWVVVGSVMLLLRVADGSLTATAAIQQFALLPPAAAFSVAGLVVALRQPRNACGWLMLVIGTIWSLGVSPPLEPDSLLEWATTWGWVPPFGLMATHLPLRLPDGRLPSPRWRWVSRLATVAMVATSVGFLFDPEIPGNPIANRGVAFIALGGLILLGVCAILSIASLVVRSRTAGADERHQIRWIAIGASVFIASWMLSFVAQPLFGVSPAADALVSSLMLVFYCAIPVSIGIAILKYRLYDIDIVIRKALIVAVLAASFVSVYALVVGGVGALVETSSNSTLSFAAAAVASSTASAQRRTRSWRSSASISRTPTRPTTCCRGRLGFWPRAWRPTAPGSGSWSAATSGRSRRGRMTPIRLAPTITPPRCATRASCWGPCRSRCRRAIRWIPPRRG